MAIPSPFEIQVLPNGELQYAYEGIPLYVVRDDNHSPRFGYEPRKLELTCPPQVNPAYVNPIDIPSPNTTRMDRYGWDGFFNFLNGDKSEQAAGKALAMFNTGWPNMESLFFGAGCIIRAVPSIQRPATWARLITLKYEDGPPAYKTWRENAVYSQRFTVICRSGNIYLHKNDFYYPVVSSVDVYMEWSWLERFSPNMESALITHPPSGSAVNYL